MVDDLKKGKTYEKTIITVLCIILCFIMCVPVASQTNEEISEKIICDATLEDNFSEDCVIVVINKNNSKPNQKHKIENFPNVTEIEDLTSIEGDIEDKKYLNKEEFRQILKLTLKKQGKEEVLKTIKKLEKYDWVESASPNYIMETESTKTEIEAGTNSRMANRQTETPFDIINANDIWELTTGSHDIKVGVIDSGISEHEDLTHNLVEGWDFFNNNSETSDDSEGHGTMVAGIIGGTGKSHPGICPNVSIVPLQVDNAENKPSHLAVILAFEYAQNNNIDIVNISSGYPKEYVAIKAGIQNYTGLIVAASGKNPINIDWHEWYPGYSQAENIICVAGVNDSETFNYDTNFGEKNVDIAAPSKNIISTSKIWNYKTDNGSSLAAPFVTGVAALMKSINPDLDAVSIKNIIMETSTKKDFLSDKVASSGILNAYEAIYKVYSDSIPKTLMGDINGDGKEDLVSVGAANTPYEGYVTVQMSTGMGDFGDLYRSSKAVVSVMDDLWLEDVTGDGRDDLICRTLNSDMDQGGLIYVAPSNGTNFHYWSFYTPSSRLTIDDQILFGDVNGDGKADLICRSAATQYDEGYLYTALSNGTGFDFWTSVSPRKVFNASDRMMLGDVNGDGMDDIIAVGGFNHFDAGIVYAAKSYGTGFEFWSNSTATQQITNLDDKVIVADVNGDGCSDLIVHTGVETWDTGYIWTAISDGNFFFFWSYNSGEPKILETDVIMIGDVNGDGRDDIICRGGDGWSENEDRKEGEDIYKTKYDRGYIWCALSTGVGFDFWTSNTERKVVNVGDRIMLADVDNNSTTDIVALGGYMYWDEGSIWVAKSYGTGFTFWTWHGGQVGY